MTTNEIVTIHRELTKAYGEDVAQEALCRFFAVTVPVDQPVHFLRRVARRLFIDEYRYRARLIMDLPPCPEPPSQIEWARCSQAYDRAPLKVEACITENRPPSTVRRYRIELRLSQ